MNPTELINDLLKRSDRSLNQLKLHYGPLIQYVIAPILPDARDREEVFSDILVRVWDRVDQFDPAHGTWSNWLSTIARNAAIDRARRNPPIGAELTETIPAPNSDPEQELIRKERQRALHTALNSLESSDKALFYTSDYHFLGDVSYQKSGFLADMIGQYNNHDVFATFSLPEDGTRQRGYLMYDVLEMNDGCIIDSWFNYIHQRSQLQFPVKSAMKYEMTSTFGVDRPFQIIQSSLQITTHGETPGLI